MAPRQLRCADYTVAWISPLPLEMTAARLLIDGETHPSPEDLEFDHNSYVFGNICGHNVVIATLAEAGTSPAARVAARMLLSFTSLKFGLLVGIGGGVPNQKDQVRLGDVVVSTPHDQYGGVVEYDHKKTLQDGKFIPKGLRNRPDDSVLTAVNNLKSRGDSEVLPLEQYINAIAAAVIPELQHLYDYPGRCRDLLLREQCIGTHEANPLSCTGKRRPAIHYGTIASGNQLMRDEIARDSLINDYKDANILCFEMEGAGLMDQFPCLIIRGISDYADRNKNDDWQRYASATAAAYAKVLLGCISQPRTANIKSISSNATSDPVTTDGQLAVVPGIQDIIAQTTGVAAAQQFGSPLYNRYTRQPMHEIILALNNNTDIISRRYYGRHIYEKETGCVLTAQGDYQIMAMSDIISAEDGEEPTQWDTMIICLSVALSPDTISLILSCAVMLYVHSTMEKSMEGTIGILRGKIKKHANSTLSRESMCKKLEKSKTTILEMIELRADHIVGSSLFLPPRTPAEEGDFAEFLAQILSAKADGIELYTRSVKLLGLALLLTEYGWAIDVSVEDDERNIIPIKDDGGLLKVVYSSSDIDREYVENHKRYLRMSRRSFYPTATCKAVNMGEVSGLSCSKTDNDQRCYMRGYNIVQAFWEKRVKSRVGPTPDGRIIMSINREKSPRYAYAGDCLRILDRFVPPNMPGEVSRLIVDALCEAYHEYDWYTLEEIIERQKFPKASFTTLLQYFEGNSDKLWTVAGAVIGVLDMIIHSLVNISGLSLIRTPADQSLSTFVTGSGSYLEALLSIGLELGRAVRFCATRLCGENPDNMGHPQDPNVANSTANIIGYWNSQQGLLLTPVFERSLYCDLPKEKARPLTMHNVPIMGMPTDDEGWIRAGNLESPIMRGVNNLCSNQRVNCKVIMEYRPFFERDSSTVVAAVYLDGVFFHMLSLSKLFSTDWHILSNCGHGLSTIPEDSQTKIPHLSLRSLQTGELAIPKSEKMVIVGPQTTRVSRLFSALVYRSFKPTIQNGCLPCAVNTAKTSRLKPLIIVPHLELPDIQDDDQLMAYSRHVDPPIAQDMF